MQKRIAILTAGGDCPGLNAVIRAVTKKAMFEYGMEVLGIEDGYEGLLEGRFHKLENSHVSGILTLGGTILGTSNKADPYRWMVLNGKTAQTEDRSREALKNIQKMNIDCLVCIGGDGTLTVAQKFFKDGVPIIGVPKTIDNDLRGTDITFGFDSAVAVATEGIDRLHTTAQSHHRVMILEVMGRRSGWIALYAGVAGGGDVILMPEIPYDIDKIIKKVEERSKIGKRFSIIVVAEGAHPFNGDVVVKKIVKDSIEPIRLGGISFVLADQIEQKKGLETRAVVLGHLQRGGSPTAFDRVLATRLGTKVIDMITQKEFGFMVGVHSDSLVKVPLEEVAKGTRSVPLNYPLIESVRAVGTCFGD